MMQGTLVTMRDARLGLPVEFTTKIDLGGNPTRKFLQMVMDEIEHTCGLTKFSPKVTMQFGESFADKTLQARVTYTFDNDSDMNIQADLFGMTWIEV